MTETAQQLRDRIARLKADLRAEQERRAEAEQAAPDAQAAERRAVQAERELERVKADAPKDRSEEVRGLKEENKKLRNQLREATQYAQAKR